MHDAFIMGFLKQAGGPGSGVSMDNTMEIGLPVSDVVSVGTRTRLLEGKPFKEKEILLSDITHVGQANYVPKKLKKFIANPEWITDKPIDVVEVDGKYHVADGHHRYLAALKTGVEKLKAKVYAIPKKEES